MVDGPLDANQVRGESRVLTQTILLHSALARPVPERHTLCDCQRTEVLPMKLDRSLFLAVATSLAAVACGSSSAETDTDEGAVQGAEGARCVDPGQDGAGPSSDLAFCTDLATRAAAVGEHFQSVQNVCSGYLTNFKSEAAKRAKTCMTGLRTELAGRGPSFDWMGLYECGYSSLRGTCEANGITSACRDLITEQTQMSTSTAMAEPAMVEAECVSFLSGLKRAGVEQVKGCVTQTKFPVYSCVEGIEPSTSAKNLCLDAKARTESGATRLQLAEGCKHLAIDEDAKGVCYQFVKASRVAMAERLVTAIQQATVDRRAPLTAANVHNIGVSALREACRAPAEVDAICTQVAAKYTAAGKSNAGGRITRECRAVFPGLLKAARDRILSGAVPVDGRIVSAIVSLPTPVDATADEFPETAE